MYRYNEWKAALQLAATEQEVQAVIDDYVSHLAPGDKFALPAACRNVLLDVDIRAATPVLVREEQRFDGASEARELLHEIVHTFVAAANRLAALESRQGR